MKNIGKEIGDGTENFSWLDTAKTVWYFLEKDKRDFLFSFFALLIIFFYEFVPVYIIGQIVDFLSNYTSPQSLKAFYIYVCVLTGTYITASIVRAYCKYRINVISKNMRTRVRVWGFERLTNFSIEWHSKENTGSKTQRIFTGADSLNKLMYVFRKDLMKIVVSILGVISFFIFENYKFILLCLAYSIIYLYIEFLMSKKTFALANEFNKLNQSAGGTYVESAGNMFSIKALGGEKGVVSRVTDKETLSLDISITRAKFFNIKWRFLHSLNGISLGLFILFTGYAVVSGAITVGMVLIFFTYFFTRLQGSLSDFSDIHGDVIELRSDVAQMMPIFKETEFVKTGNEKFPKDWSKIEIKNANMIYSSGGAGIDKFDLVIKKNQKIGIAGSSGSGKSTIVKIMLGMHALNSGDFLINDKDYYKISHKETLDNIAVVLQETELFNLSLEENITMMRSFDAELFKTAIEISQLEEVIKRLPEGLSSKIGEKGYMLSGGERQRLGIARAIYKNAPIIIMDEATSSLDGETEGKIMTKLFGEYGKDKTFLIIAHRLGTLKYTDKIVVMEKGAVVEEGNYDDLMSKRDSVFYRMSSIKEIENRS